MHSVAHQFVVVAVATLAFGTLLIPGWSLASLFAITRRPCTEMVLLASVVFGLAWCALATAIVVLPGLPQWQFGVLMALPVLAATARWFRIGRGTAHLDGETRRLRVACLTGFLAWAGIVAIVVGVYGATFNSDGSFHASFVHKLATLHAPDAHALSPFDDGAIDIAVLVPAWHQLFAFVARPFNVAYPGLVAVQAWSMTAAALLTIVSAGVGRVATGRFAGAVACTVIAPLLVFVDWWDEFPMILRTIGYPGNVVQLVLLPALFAILAHIAIDGGGEDAPDPLHARRWCVVLGAGTLALGALHVNYAWYLVLVGLGMLAIATLFDRRVARRLLSPALVVAGALVATVLAMLPVLLDDDELGRGTGGDTGARVRTMWQHVLAGHDSFAISGKWFLSMGAPFVLGTLAAALVIPITRAGSRERMRALLLVVVPTLLLGTVARWSVSAELVAGAGSFTAIPRTTRIMPAAAALTVALVAIDQRFAVASRRPARVWMGWAIGTLAAALVVVAALTTGAGSFGNDLGTHMKPILPGRTFDVLLVVLAVELIVAFVRARRSRTPQVDAMTSRPRAATAFVAVLLVASAAVAFPSVHRAFGNRARTTLDSPGLLYDDIPRSTYELAARFPAGTVVLTDPEDSLKIAATSVAKITSTAKTSLSTTAREAAIEPFIHPGRFGSDAERAEYLDEHEVDVIMFPMRPEMAAAVRRIVDASDAWELREIDDGTRLYCRVPCDIA